MSFLVHRNRASIVRWRATSSPIRKKTHDDFNNPTHGPTASGQTTRSENATAGPAAEAPSASRKEGSWDLGNLKTRISKID